MSFLWKFAFQVQELSQCKFLPFIILMKILFLKKIAIYVFTFYDLNTLNQSIESLQTTGWLWNLFRHGGGTLK